jgi:predicted nucleotidyltransferase
MKNKRWSLSNNPFGFELPKRPPIIHPIINKWDDFSEEDKVILSNIKRIIVENIGDCRMSIFGSRVKGYWTEQSDYDIIVFKEISEEKLKEIKSIDYGARVDFNFYTNNLPINIKIEIP